MSGDEAAGEIRRLREQIATQAATLDEARGAISGLREALRRKTAERDALRAHLAEVEDAGTRLHDLVSAGAEGSQIRDAAKAWDRVWQQIVTVCAWCERNPIQDLRSRLAIVEGERDAARATSIMRFEALRGQAKVVGDLRGTIRALLEAGAMLAETGEGREAARTDAALAWGRAAYGAEVDLGHYGGVRVSPKREQTGCPQCGYEVPLDEDQTCAECGADCAGDGARAAWEWRARAIAAAGEIRRLREQIATQAAALDEARGEVKAGAFLLAKATDRINDLEEAHRV